MPRGRSGLQQSVGRLSSSVSLFVVVVVLCCFVLVYGLVFGSVVWVSQYDLHSAKLSHISASKGLFEMIM